MSLPRSYVSKNALTGPTGAYLPPHKLSTCWAIISWMLKHTQKPIISGCVLISHIPMSWLWTAIFSSTNMVLFVLMSRNSSAASFPHQPLNIFAIICLLNELLSESHSRRSRQQKGGNWSLSVHRVTLTLSLWTTASKVLWNVLFANSSANTASVWLPQCANFQSPPEYQSATITSGYNRRYDHWLFSAGFSIFQMSSIRPPLSVLNCNPKLFFIVWRPFMAASPVQHCHVISTPTYNTHILPCNHYYQYMKVCTFQGGYNTWSSWAFLRVAAARSKISLVAHACWSWQCRHVVDKQRPFPDLLLFVAAALV